MPISGKFIADFESFRTETAKAKAELKGLEVQAQSSAAAADRIGASSSVATTGVTGLTTATTALSSSEAAAVAATASLDTALATETVALAAVTEATTVASAASGAYGSVLFATAEAEVAATGATVGFGTAVTTTAAAVVSGLAALAPLIAALGIITKYLVDYYEESEKAALKAETLAAKQDTINKAISEGAPKWISYGDAIKYVNQQEAHRIAMNPAAAANAYIAKLVEQGKEAIRTAGEEAALTEGLAARGIVLGETIDVEKLMTDARKASAKAAKDTAREDQEYFDAVVALSNKLYEIENPMRDNIFLMGDLGRLGKQASNGVDELFKSTDALQKKLAELERQGIPAVFTQTDLSKVGEHQTNPITEAQKKAIEAAEAMNKAVMDEFNRLPLMMADAIRSGDFTNVGRQMGEFIGAAIGGPIGEAIGSFLPEIGQGIANFFGKLFGLDGPTKFDQKVQDIINRLKEFQEAQKAAVDAQAEVDDAKHAGGARSNEELQHSADVARKAFEEALASGKYNQENLDKLYLAFQQALADAGDEAARAWLKAHDAAKSGAAAVNAEMQKLIDRRDELTKGISQEAPEAEMGVIEKQMRAERDAIEQQIKDAQTAADAAADAQGDAADITKERWGDASQVMQDELSQAGDDAASHIKDAFDFTIHIPIVFDNPGLPVVPMESGGSGRVTRPTLFYSAGNEDFAFSGEGRSFAGAPSRGGVTFGDIHVYADGASLSDMQQFAPKFIEALRSNTGGLYDGIQTVASRATA